MNPPGVELISWLHIVRWVLHVYISIFLSPHFDPTGRPAGSETYGTVNRALTCARKINLLIERQWTFSLFHSWNNSACSTFPADSNSQAWIILVQWKKIISRFSEWYREAHNSPRLLSIAPINANSLCTSTISSFNRFSTRLNNKFAGKIMKCEKKPRLGQWRGAWKTFGSRRCEPAMPWNDCLGKFSCIFPRFSSDPSRRLWKMTGNYDLAKHSKPPSSLYSRTIF